MYDRVTEMTVQKKAKTRYSQIVLWLVLVACSTAAGQESATLTADAIVKARETVNFVSWFSVKWRVAVLR